jgi:hypothetical protein
MINSSKKARLVKMIHEAIEDLESLARAYDRPAMSPGEVSAATGETMKDIEYYPRKLAWHSTKLDKILTDNDFQEIKLFAIEEFLDTFLNSINRDQANKILNNPSELGRLRSSLSESAEFKTFLNDFLLKKGNKHAVSSEKNYREQLTVQHGISDSTANAIMNMVLGRVDQDMSSVNDLKKRMVKDGKTQAEADAYVSRKLGADVRKYQALFSSDIVTGAMKAYQKDLEGLPAKERLKKFEEMQATRKAEFGDIMATPKQMVMVSDDD